MALRAAHLPAGWLAGGAVALDIGLLLLGWFVPRAMPAMRADVFASSAMLLAIPLTILFCAQRGAYRPAVVFDARLQIQAVVVAVAGAWAVVGASGAAFYAGASRSAVPLLWAAAVNLCLLVLGRVGLALALSGPGGDRTRMRIIVLGDVDRAGRLAALLRQNRDRSLRLLGTASVTSEPGRAAAAGLPDLGTLDDILEMIQDGDVDQVLITFPYRERSETQELQALSTVLRRLSDQNVDVRLLPDPILYQRSARTTARPHGIELPQLLGPPLSGGKAVAKVVEDYVLALLILVLSAVPLLLIALAIRLDSPGPVLFRQHRIGRNGRAFEILKFRTMYQESADLDARCQVQRGDPRVTRVGRILRQTSLDELPQLLNVIRGEMSLVGPRPHAPGTSVAGRRFDEICARYQARHRMKPGLTGLAQIKGWRGPTDTEEKLVRRILLDLEYIDRWSIGLDLLILLRTLPAVAFMRNAI
jgi:Undecaprenyl-phosphate glucose phosphotransferase